MQQNKKVVLNRGDIKNISLHHFHYYYKSKAQSLQKYQNIPMFTSLSLLSFMDQAFGVLSEESLAHIRTPF